MYFTRLRMEIFLKNFRYAGFLSPQYIKIDIIIPPIALMDFIMYLNADFIPVSKMKC
jgi:hypothetical protein